MNTTGETKRKIKKYQTIEFRHISELTGHEIILRGTILGFGDAVRKMWPDEMAEAPDDMLLVWRMDSFGNKFHYAVEPDQIVKEEK